MKTTFILNENKGSIWFMLRDSPNYVGSAKFFIITTCEDIVGIEISKYVDTVSIEYIP